MDNSPIIRFRLDRSTAERAHRMATDQGLELPDVMRMMVTRAVRIGDFSIDKNRDFPTSTGTGTAIRPATAYEARYWSEAMGALQAETALAVLHRAIAERTAELDRGLTLKVPDLKRLEQLRDERDEACAWLAAFDPKDATTVSKILARFTPELSQLSSSQAAP